MKYQWRDLFCPEFLFLLGAVQANLPYLLWKLGYPIPEAYQFIISYRPLYLWIFAYIAFCLGTGFISYFHRNTQRIHNFTPFQIHPSNLRFCIIVIAVAAVIQIILACRLYSVVPLFAFSSGYDVATVNEMQDESGFGQLGLMRLTIFILSGLILIGIVSNFKEIRHDKILLRASAIVVIFGSLFSGKTQGFFIFICFLLTGCALTGANPINLFMRKFGFPQLSRKQTIIAIVGLFFLLIILHGFTRYWRSGRYEDFNIKSSFDSVISYLSWPLMNMEKQTEYSGIEGEQIDVRGLVKNLLPYKLRWHFLDEQNIEFTPRVEPTCGSGFLGAIHWYLGLWGMLVLVFIIGALCKYFYIKSAESLFCLLAYSQIAWTLIAAHTYNHFLNLIFIPAPLISFFIINKIIQPTLKYKNNIHTRTPWNTTCVF